MDIQASLPPALSRVVTAEGVRAFGESWAVLAPSMQTARAATGPSFPFTSRR